MHFIFVLSIIIVFLAFLSQFKELRFLFEFSFIFIFLITALRFDFGTDYQNYYNSFKEIGQASSFKSIPFHYYRFEPGWAVLNYIFKPVGFFGFIIVLSSFTCYTYYSLIKKYVEPEYYWFAIFIFVFSWEIMWIQFSAIRQALAIAIFINSIKFLSKDRNPIKFLLLIICASLFHSTALFLIPLLLFSSQKLSKNNIIGIVVIFFFFVLLFFGDLFISSFINISSFIAGERYLSVFLYEIDISTTLFGSLLWGSLLIIIIFYSRRQEKNEKHIFVLFSLYYLIYVLSPLFWLVERMGYYFIPLSIVVFPMIIKQERNLAIKIGLFLFFSFSIYNRSIKFVNLDWVLDGYSYYKTIFVQ
jgi:hypothetical protein